MPSSSQIGSSVDRCQGSWAPARTSRSMASSPPRPGAGSRAGVRDPTAELIGPPAKCPFSPTFCGGGFIYQIDCRKSWYPYCTRCALPASAQPSVQRFLFDCKQQSWSSGDSGTDRFWRRWTNEVASAEVAKESPRQVHGNA